MTEDNELENAAGSENGGRNTGYPGSEWQSAGQGAREFFASPGVKFVIIGFITIALLVPAMLVWALVEERAHRAETVANSIAKGWGSQQRINGPYLVVPYRISKQVGKNMKVVTRYALLSPETLETKGEVDVEERQKSIYKTQLYHSRLEMTGQFSNVELERIVARGGRPLAERAFLAIGVSDMTGFRSDVELAINGIGERKFLPGLNGLANRTDERAGTVSSGVHYPLTEDDLKKGFEFTIDLTLNGSRDISIVPAGKTSSINMRSNWPHPGFDGQFLPEKREMSPDGFSAEWTIPNLARGIDALVYSTRLPSASSAIKINFVEPLKFYQVTARTLKYSIGFFSLIFLAVFILELRGRRAIHWIQYMLVGLSMVVFYVLLLAFAEQVGFALAYLISSIATILLIAWYVGDSLGQQRSSVIMGFILSALFLLMYLIMSEEDYALLAGSITAFLAIAATMIATRRVSWSNRPAEANPAT